MQHERQSIFACDWVLHPQLKLLHPSVFAIGVLLDEARDNLLEIYADAEKAPEEIDHNVAQDLYERFQTCFQAAVDHSNTAKYTVEIAKSIYEAAVDVKEKWPIMAKKRSIEITSDAVECPGDDAQPLAADEATGVDNDEGEQPVRKKAKITQPE